MQYSSGAALARLTVFAYDANGVREQTGTEMWFPLRCAGGVFTLTLDAMASAELLGRCAASDALQRTSLYSVTRLPGVGNAAGYLCAPDRPPRAAGPAACYTVSRPVLTGRANTLLAEDTEIRGGVLHGRIASFRHLYNLRWLTGRYAQADLLLTAAELDWTGGAALVYQAPQGGRNPPLGRQPGACARRGVPHGAGNCPAAGRSTRGPCAVRFAAARRFGLCFGRAGRNVSGCSAATRAPSRT